MTLLLRCPVCGLDMPAQLVVCRPCSSGLWRDLADVPSLEVQLDLTLTRQTRVSDRGGSRSTESALPYDPRARRAISQLRGALLAWCRLLHTDAVRHGPACRVCAHPSCAWIARAHWPADTLAGMARWLIRQRQALVSRPDLPDAVDELGGAVRRARSAIDRPPAVWYAGSCGCGADLYARHGATLITCRACKATVTTSSQERWLMAQAADTLGTATEIARALHAFQPGLTPAMIRGYAFRGRLASRGTNAAGHAMYRLGDVLALLNERIAS